MQGPTTQPAPACGDESLAERFTGQMNAATSRFGALSEIPFAFVAVAVLVVILALVHRLVPSLGLSVLGPIAALPLVVCVVANLAFRGARGKVVAWLQTVPFPIDNLNAVLSGAGEHFQIHFAGAPPDRATVMAALEAVCPEGYVIDTDEAQRLINARFGIDESKYNPIGVAHRRYEATQRLIGGPLAAVHATHPITLIRFL